MPERVLVTGARAAAALEIARAFAQAGFSVHMADSASARISRWSSAVAKVHALPSPRRDRAGYRAAVAGLVERVRPTVIVPTCEEVFHLAAFDLSAPLFAPPLETLRRLHDKALFAGDCAAAGLPVPETHRLAEPADLQHLRGDTGSWVLKARFSRFGAATLVDPEPEDLRQVAAAPDRGWIAQRRIRGHEISFYAVAHAGALVAFAAYDSRWRLRGGASLVFDVVGPALAAKTLGLARRIAARHDLTGQFACDLMVDDDGQPWLLECNPRATSGVHLLSGGAGLARAMLGAEDSLLTVHGGQRQVLPALVTFGLANAIRTRRMAEWLSQVRAAPDVTGRPGDRWPLLGAVIDGLGFSLAGMVSGQGAAAASTADIEWNGEDLQ